MLAHLSITIKLFIVGFLPRPSEAKAELVSSCVYKCVFLELYKSLKDVTLNY